MISSSCTSSIQPTEAPIELIYPATQVDECDNNDSAISRSSAARRGIGITSIMLLLSSLLGLGFISSARNANELSNSVKNLTEIVHDLKEEEEKNIRKLRTLELELDEKEIELAWEKQHVSDEIHDSKANEKELFDAGLRNFQFKLELNKQKEENTNLKNALDIAIKALSDQESALPAKPRNLRRAQAI